MEIYFSSSLCPAYFKAISIVKREQPELWELFSESIPVFSAVPNVRMAAVMAHIKYRKDIKDSVKYYAKYWEKDARIIIERLNRLFGYSLPEKKVMAYVCVTPLYIRNIEKGFFLLPVHGDRGRIMNIIIHELSHFYCYHGFDLLEAKLQDSWEISEYIVPPMIHAFFSDLCDESEESYVGKTPERYEKYICGWIRQKYSFMEMLRKISPEGHGEKR